MQRTLQHRALIGWLACLALVCVALCFAAPAQSAFADDSLSPAGTDFAAQSASAKDRASLAPLGKKTTGELTSVNEEDWYRVKLKKAGKFTLDFGGAGGLVGSWKVTLYNAKSKEIWSTVAYRFGLRDATVLTTGLPKGTYYLNVKQDTFGAMDHEYFFTPKLAASKLWETELNDKRTQADVAKLGKTNRGNLQTQDDQDFYKIKVKKAGKFTLTFAGEDGVARAWNLTLLNAKDVVVWSGTYTESDSKAHTVLVTGLRKGTYYLKVENALQATGLTYRITPRLKARTNWEAEMNDAAPQAKAAKRGKTYYGNLQRVDDVDYYKLTMKKAAKLRVVFGGQSAEAGSWGIALQDASGKQVALGLHQVTDKADTIAIDQNLEAGMYYLRVNNILNASGLKYHFMATTKTPIAAASITGISSKTYTGEPIKPNPSVKIGYAKLIKGTDYTVAYANNKNAGTATVTIKGKGQYSGSVKATFKVKRAALADENVKNISAKKKTGKAIKPSPKVTYNGVKLVKGTDYKLSYENNVKAGNATVKVTGIGNYTGTVAKTFVIK